MSHQGHDHRHHHGGFRENLVAGDRSPVDRLLRVVVNMARRWRPGHAHDCCGNYGEPGC